MQKKNNKNGDFKKNRDIKKPESYYYLYNFVIKFVKTKIQK